MKAISHRVKRVKTAYIMSQKTSIDMNFLCEELPHPTSTLSSVPDIRIGARRC
jgi:hypothetical protein